MTTSTDVIVPGTSGPRPEDPNKTTAQQREDKEAVAKQKALDAEKKRHEFISEQKVEVAKASAKLEIEAAQKKYDKLVSDPPEVKYCEVCGMGSHREDWQKATGAVYCDNHKPGATATAEPRGTALGTSATSVAGHDSGSVAMPSTPGAVKPVPPAK